MLYWKNFLGVVHAEFWDRINYYGLQSILVLYLTHKLGLSDNESLDLFGAYVSLAFGMTILGGFFADKILGVFNASILGAILVFFGNLILIRPEVTSFYLGLGFVITGIGFLKPSNPTLIGFMCREDSYLRTKLFSTFYFCLNLGCIFGPIMYGLAVQTNHYKYCYILSALGMLSAILVLVLQRTSFRQHLEKARNITWKESFFLFVGVFISVVICTFLLIQHKLFFWFFLGVLLLVILYLLKVSKKLTVMERKSLYALLIPFASSIIFFTMLLQIYSSITLYAERGLNQCIFGWAIPTAWFSSIEAVFVSLLLPLLTYFWKWMASKKLMLSSESKIIFGLFIASVAFVVFSVSVLARAHPMVAILMVVLANAFLAIGELAVIPISMSLTNILAPRKLKGTFMGMYYFVLMSSGYLAGQIAKLAPPNELHRLGFLEFFILIAFLLATTGFGMLILNRFLK